MIRELKLATVFAVAVSIVGITGSAEAHIGRGGGGFRIGGGLVRGRQQGNGNRVANPPVAPAPAPKVVTPAPKTTSPIVKTGGTNTGTSSKPAATSTSTQTNKPSNGTVVTAPKSTMDKPPSAPAPAQPAASPPAIDLNLPADSNLVFSLGNPSADAPAAKPTGLSLEAKKALEDTLAADDPPAEAPPAEVKEVPLPQIPVGATVTLNGQDLSGKEGQVVLQIGEIALPATISKWNNDRVTCTLPVLGLTKASKATLHVLKADGKTANSLNIELVTPADAKSSTASSVDGAKFPR